MNFARIGNAVCACTLALGFLAGATCRADEQQFLAGADISMLPVIEKAGGMFHENGQPADAIHILHDHGCNLFRVRLFVRPDPDFAKSDGAVQDLNYVRALAKRIKAVGATFLLDIHYSDTWADPGKQFTPQDWKSLDFDALQKQVHDYTASVLTDLRDNGAMPDMVQVGNEVTAGILWPQGKVLDAPPATEAQQWASFSRLLNAGCSAVRQFDTPQHRIRIVIHIHGGGREGLPKWFFSKFNRNPVDYDVVGLSFYPAWNDSIDALKQNMADAIAATGKDVFIAETSYPWRAGGGIEKNSTMRWSLTPAGQKQFVEDLTAVIRAAPGHHGLGYCWWYAEAIPVADLRIWRGGAEALFDQNGTALPAMDVLGRGE
jgi:arabinogalactan endo-1,4-beta-galactosidase